MSYRRFMNLFGGLGPDSVLRLVRAQDGSDVVDDPAAAESEMSAVFG